jgi:hypothetical protein
MGGWKGDGKGMKRKVFLTLLGTLLGLPPDCCCCC